MTTLDLKEVASGLGFPEGPVAMADGSLLFVDIKNKTLSRLTAGGQVEVVAELGGGPNGVAIGPDGAAYVCNNGGVYGFIAYPPPNGPLTVPDPSGPPSDFKGGWIQRVDLKTGAVKNLYERKGLLSPDDIVFDKSGAFWFTDSGVQGPGEIVKGGVYRATTDEQSLTKVATIPTANGIGLSPDGATLYVSDTAFGRLWALDLDGKGGVRPGPMPGIMPGRVVQTLPGFQWLDSLKVEATGRVCVGTLLNGGVTVFSPVDALPPVHVAIPDLFTTNLCFGGPDMQDMWITASSTGKIYKARWPRPGLPLAFSA